MECFLIEHYVTWHKHQSCFSIFLLQPSLQMTFRKTCEYKVSTWFLYSNFFVVNFQVLFCVVFHTPKWRWGNGMPSSFL